MKMFPTAVLSKRVPDMLAADATTLAPVALANHVHLINALFNPAPDTIFDPTKEATFTGGGAKSAGIGAQQSFRDPVNNDRVVELLEPAGGWTWICTVTPGAAETIYGVIITDNADAVTFASFLFAVPVVITNAGDAVVVDNLQLRLALGFMYPQPGP